MSGAPESRSCSEKRRRATPIEHGSSGREHTATTHRAGQVTSGKVRSGRLCQVDLQVGQIGLHRTGSYWFKCSSQGGSGRVSQIGQVVSGRVWQISPVRLTPQPTSIQHPPVERGDYTEPPAGLFTSPPNTPRACPQLPAVSCGVSPLQDARRRTSRYRARSTQQRARSDCYPDDVVLGGFRKSTPSRLIKHRVQLA